MPNRHVLLIVYSNLKERLYACATRPLTIGVLGLVLILVMAGVLLPFGYQGAPLLFPDLPALKVARAKVQIEDAHTMPRREGEPYYMTLTVEGLRPDRYHQFNHLYAIDGDAPLQVMDRPVSSPSWQAGDTLITWAIFAPDEPGAYRFEVGMYTYPGLERVAIQDAAPDNPAAIGLGPLE